LWLQYNPQGYSENKVVGTQTMYYFVISMNFGVSIYINLGALAVFQAITLLIMLLAFVT
jgi:hypothetical protein